MSEAMMRTCAATAAGHDQTVHDDDDPHPPRRRFGLLVAVALPLMVLAAVTGGWVGLALVGIGAAIVAAGMLDRP
jgi:hypothetical protein